MVALHGCMQVESAAINIALNDSAGCFKRSGKLHMILSVGMECMHALDSHQEPQIH